MREEKDWWNSAATLYFEGRPEAPLNSWDDPVDRRRALPHKRCGGERELKRVERPSLGGQRLQNRLQRRERDAFADGVVVQHDHRARSHVPE